MLGPQNMLRLQDPFSFRCLAPVLASTFAQLDRAAEAINVDLNGADDSLAALLDEGEMLSTVNFGTTAIALAFEGLGLALSHAAAASVFRIAKMI